MPPQVMGDRAGTVDGFEKTFQLSHLAPFLLTELLLDVLLASRSTVVVAASEAAKKYGHLDLEDLNSEHGYDPTSVYGTSKLANILFTRELQHRLGDQGLSTVCFHPGNVATNFAHELYDRSAAMLDLT